MEQNKKAEAILIVIKRIAKWILLSALGLVALALVVGLGIFIYQKWENRPKVVSELNGVSIGDKLNDVLFKNPDLKLSDLDKKNRTQETSSKYMDKEGRKNIFFSDDDKVSLIDYTCADTYEYTSINGIKCNDTSENIEKKYGNKVRVLCHTNTKFKVRARAYDIVEYGIRYKLLYNSVFSFSVAQPELLKTFVGFSWGNCD
jgi:hypothetical protein